MFIKESEVRRIFSLSNWQLTLKYNERDIISGMEISHKQSDWIYYITALVDTGSSQNRVSITLRENGLIPNFSCDCPFCTVNSNACAHIGVVLLKVNSIQPTTFPFYYNSTQENEDGVQHWLKIQMAEKSRAFVNRYAKLSELEFHASLQIDKVKLFAHADIEFNEIMVSYKLGTDKLYVIKNIAVFLIEIDNKKKVSYGKLLSFYHHIDAFDDIAKQQINFLKQYITHYDKTYIYKYGSNHKTITINSASIDAFYALYNDEASEYINISFGKEDIMQLSLHVKQNDDFFYIQFNYPKESIIRGEQYWYFLDHKTLYRFQKNITTYCSNLLEDLQTDNQILIHKDDMKDFCTYVISTVMEYIHIDGITIEDYMPASIFIQCYIDMEENGDISIKITYHLEDAPIEYAINDKENTYQHRDLDHILQFIKEFATVVDYDAHIAYIQEDDPKIPSFLGHGLEFLNQYCEVFISDAIRQINTPKKVQLQVGVHMNNNLLEIDINSVQIPKDEIYRVLSSYRKRKRYYRLKNGDLLYLQSEEFQEVDTFLQDIQVQPSKLDNGKTTIPNYHAFELEDFAKDAEHIKINRNQQFQSMMKSIHAITPHTFQIPEHYRSILRDYQKFGYQWLKTMSAYGLGGILADDMGLGKTLQMIAFFEQAKSELPTMSAIVITPASLILNWRDELDKFSKDLSCLCIHGTTANRMNLIKEIPNYDIIITSYDYIRRDYEVYKNLVFQFVVLDEAQYIKNHKTKNAFAVKQLQSVQRFALSGTPIENSLAELWSIFDFLMPGYLYNYHYFRSNFEREIVKNNNEKVQNKLKKMVEPFILRRIKKNVLKELPDKIESVHFLEFDEEERKIYYANLAKINKELQQKMQLEEVDKFMILAMMTRLRQICCDNRLLYENVHTISSKLTGCMELILAAKASRKKVLLFSSFTSMLALIEAECLKENIRYLKLTGETKKEQRREYVEKFQNEPYDLFLISLKAGGTGLNLTAAEIVIHFDPWWNMSAQNQATDRAYRIGQTKNIQVYKLIMKDSIEEKILKMQQRKMQLSDSFVAGNEGSITAMSNEEIMNLFK